MGWDELAAAVVGVEESDLPELEKIRLSLLTLRAETGLSEEAGELADEAADLVDSIVCGECDDTGAALGAVRQNVSRVLSIVEEELWGDEAAARRDSLAGGEDTSAASSRDPEKVEIHGEAAQSALQGDAAAEGSTGIDVDLELLGEFVTESLEHIENAEAGLLALEGNPDDGEAIAAVFRAFHTIKGTAGFMGFSDIQKLAHRAENLLDKARNGEVKLTGINADLSLEAVDLLKAMIQDCADDPQAVNSSVGEKAANLIARLEHPEAAGASDSAATATAASEGEKGGGDTRDSRIISQSSSGDDNGRRTNTRSGGAGADVTVRISTKRLDALVNMIGELVIAQAMVAQNGHVTSETDPTLSRNVGRMSKITRELQDLSMSMRMVPLRPTFQKMARLARDLGKKSGKAVAFITEGEDTEIDRNMVESLNDPLVHMIRNAVDHGVEPQSERVANGKAKHGHLVLRAYHAAGNVVIELQDDGKGLDREKIISKAVDLGLVDADQSLSDGEVFKLIFAAGFSTAEKVTDVSGRGVGMDVVRKNVEAMRGRVEVSSAKGKGSTFSIRIPLTLAIIDGMLVRAGGEHYIVPTLNVGHAFRPKSEALSTVTGKGEMVLLRRNLIPVFRLHRLFNISGAEEDPTRALLLVVEQEGEKVALLADELLGKQQVVIKSIGNGLGEIEGVSGAAILGDGRVGLILDIAGVISAARGRGRRETA